MPGDPRALTGDDAADQGPGTSLGGFLGGVIATAASGTGTGRPVGEVGHRQLLGLLDVILGEAELGDDRHELARLLEAVELLVEGLAEGRVPRTEPEGAAADAGVPESKIQLFGDVNQQYESLAQGRVDAVTGTYLTVKQQVESRDGFEIVGPFTPCLLYTSDAADE